MDYPDALPIVFLYTEGRERIEGITRFQKLVFLFQEETDYPESDVYDYVPEKYGPFSVELEQALHSLEAEGLVEKQVWQNEFGNEKYVYSLTVDGIQFAQKLLRDSDMKSLFDDVQAIKSRYNDWGLERLLRYVYNRYEDYTTETELDTDRLFDPEAESVFVEQRSEEESELQYRRYISNADVSENADGTWTARDLDKQLTALGETRGEALDNLGEVIAATEGDAGHAPTDEEIEELGVDPDQARDSEVGEIPEFMK